MQISSVPPTFCQQIFRIPLKYLPPLFCPPSPPLSGPLFFKKHVRNDTMYDDYLPLCLFICLSVSQSVSRSVRLFLCLFGSFNNNFDVRILHLAANINNYNYKTCVFLISMRIPPTRLHPLCPLCVGLVQNILFAARQVPDLLLNIFEFLNYASVNSFRCRSTNLWQVKICF